MIPRLEAEESIRRSKEIMVGTGAILNPRAITEQWERLALAGAAAPPSTRTRKPALFSDEVLARLPVRRVPRKG